MAMSPEITTSSKQLSRQLSGAERSRTSGPAGLPGLESADERPGFADMLRQASNGLRQPRRPEGVRPAARREQERPEPPDAGRAESSSLDRAEQERTTPDRATDERDEDLAEDPDAASKAVAAAGEDAAATTQAVQALVVPLVDDGADGEGDEGAEENVTFQIVAEHDDGEGDGRPMRTTAAPSSPPLSSVMTESGIQSSGLQSPGQGGNAIDLLSVQDSADVGAQVETEEGQMMERLQQALATNHVDDLDELGRPVVPQVVRSMMALTRNGVSEMRLQLQPGDLGEIELRVRAVEGMIRGEVMVQHVEVKNLLDSQIERLRAALEAQGLQLEGLEVGVSDDGAFARDSADDENNRTPFGGLAHPDDDATEAVHENGSAVPRRPIQLSDDAVDWLV